MTQQSISNQTLTMDTVHLQRLRAALLVYLNRVYPKKLDCPSLSALQHGEASGASFESFTTWRSWASCVPGEANDGASPLWEEISCLALVEAKGIMQPAMLDSRGED